MKRIVIGTRNLEPVAIDLEALVDTRLLIQANSGGGKSWCLRRLLEQSHGQVQHLVIDPEGEFATLRERFDYVLAARRGGDTAADPRIARLLAERLLELGVSAVLDIYELQAHERVRFVRGFLEALVDAPKKLWHPALVVLDEAHVFCPQQGEAESAGAVIDLATRGRKRGFAAVLATQRLSKLHKDAAAECNNKLIGRTGLDVDVKRAADELGFGKDRWRELRELPAGRFFGFGPALSREVAAVVVGPVETTHPKAGSRIALTPPPARDRVKALLPKLADLPAEAEERQKSLEDLKREVQQLRRDLAAAKKASPAPPAPKKVEVPVLSEAALARAEKVSEKLTAAAHAAGEMARDLAGAVRGARGDRSAAAKMLSNYDAQAEISRRLHSVATVTEARVAAAKKGMMASGAGDASEISGSQQRILDSLAWLETVGLSPAEKTQIALMAEQSPTSGGYFNNLGRLRSLALIEYPSAGKVALTASGRDRAAPTGVPSSSDELQEQVLGRLSTSQARILKTLIRAYPAALAKNELAAAAEQSPTSGGYFNNLGRLRSLGLIDYPAPGSAVALPVLFLEGRA